MLVITEAFSELKRQADETRKEDIRDRKETAKLREDKRREDRENQKR